MVDCVIDLAVMFGVWFDKAQMLDRYSSLRHVRVGYGDKELELASSILTSNEIRVERTLLGDIMDPAAYDYTGITRDF